jgi:hypothetical protein
MAIAFGFFDKVDPFASIAGPILEVLLCVANGNVDEMYIALHIENQNYS